MKHENKPGEDRHVCTVEGCQYPANLLVKSFTGRVWWYCDLHLRELGIGVQTSQ